MPPYVIRIVEIPPITERIVMAAALKFLANRNIRRTQVLKNIAVQSVKTNVQLKIPKIKRGYELWGIVILYARYADMIQNVIPTISEKK